MSVSILVVKEIKLTFNEWVWLHSMDALIWSICIHVPIALVHICIYMMMTNKYWYFSREGVKCKNLWIYLAPLWCGLNLNLLAYNNHVWVGPINIDTIVAKVKFCSWLPSFNKMLSRHQVSCLVVLLLLSYVSSSRRRRRRTTWT